mmetsp:Transcript_64892/g.141419  ORF Transcript_64892/g.141419 Transcript_64892/m.141419 type:complete len:455 (-) Transcript_64892:167-1531(-)
MSEADDDDVGDILIQLTAQILLFILLTGISGSVNTDQFVVSFRRWRGIVTGLGCQFVILPLLGFISAKAFDLPPYYGIALIATTASPGGAYSNWWCSLLNADLALSVAMTSCSTLASIVCMPVNLMLYTRFAYGKAPSLEWPRLFASISVAMLAISTGTCLSYLRPRWRNRCNIAGNAGGLLLISFGVLTSSNDSPLWDKDAKFYSAVSLPCFGGLASAFCLSFLTPWLNGPEAVAVTIETSYQNTGLALSVALATFAKKDRAAAASVPLFYGVVEACLLPVFLIVSWKIGLTHAPKHISLWSAVTGNFQPEVVACNFNPSYSSSEPDVEKDEAASSQSGSSEVRCAESQPGEVKERTPTAAAGVDNGVAKVSSWRRKLVAAEQKLELEPSPPRPVMESPPAPSTEAMSSHQSYQTQVSPPAPPPHVMEAPPTPPSHMPRCFRPQAPARPMEVD